MPIGVYNQISTSVQIMELKVIQRAASELSARRLGPDRMDLLPPELRPADEADAYSVQEALHDLFVGAGLEPSLAIRLAVRRSLCSVSSVSIIRVQVAFSNLRSANAKAHLALTVCSIQESNARLQSD